MTQWLDADSSKPLKLRNELLQNEEVISCALAIRIILSGCPKTGENKSRIIGTKACRPAKEVALRMANVSWIYTGSQWH
jgi:hypothetical protein